MNRFEALAVDWLRALRGRRSQRTFSRRLGYKSNIAYRWESGHCWPTAHTVLRLMKRMKIDVRAALVKFYASEPTWLRGCDPTSAEGVARLLDDLRGGTSIVQLAATSGFSRHQIARWLSTKTEPRLPEWFAVVEAASFRLLDFVAAFFDPAALPSIADGWRRLQASREAAYARPESHMVLRCLELADYRALRTHSDQLIAKRLGLDERRVRECLELLEAAGQIRWVDDKWNAGEESAIDTRHDPVRARALKAWWLRTAATQLESGREGIFGYNLFSISAADLTKVREIHLRYYREMQDVIANSKPNERVVYFGAQLFALDVPDL
jgi:DNA-binding phage protein